MSTPRLLLSTLPRSVLLSLRDARRSFLCVDFGGQSPEATLWSAPDTVADIDALLAKDETTEQAIRGSRTDASVVYDVMRVKGRHPVFYAQHMQRFLNSLCSSADQAGLAAATAIVEDAAERMTITASYCKSVDAVEDDEQKRWPEWFVRRFDHAVRAAIAAQPEDDVEQNLKVIAWLGTPTSIDDPGCILPSPPTALHPSDFFSVAAFYITSTYPPTSWYEAGGGTRVALLYHAARSNPNAKIVQAPLRQRAAEQQKRLGVFESILVHAAEDGYKAPEGSRSNFLCILDEGAVGDGDGGAALPTVVGSKDRDILVGVTLCALRQGVGRYSDPHGAPFRWEQRDVTLADILKARSVVMLGTSVGVLPIASIVVSEGEEEHAELQRYILAHGQACGTPQVDRRDGVGLVHKQSTTDPVVHALMKLYYNAHKR